MLLRLTQARWMKVEPVVNVSVLPEFADVPIEDQVRTAIKLVVEPQDYFLALSQTNSGPLHLAGPALHRPVGAEELNKARARVECSCPPTYQKRLFRGSLFWFNTLLRESLSTVA